MALYQLFNGFKNSQSLLYSCIWEFQPKALKYATCSELFKAPKPFQRPGLIKLAGEGGKLKLFVIFGEEKSSISSFKTIPVEVLVITAPKLEKRSSF